MAQLTRFSNGLRVVTQELKDRDSVAVGLWVGVGGRYETDQHKGAAHFLEHILFKGSRNFSCDDIKRQIEGVGGSVNAFTGEEQTCYYAKVPAKHLSRAFEVLSDMVRYPAIKPADVKKERAVILEEIKMYRDLPQYYVMELLDALMWPGHPLGKGLAGTPESVSALTSRGLKGFHSQYYSAGHIVVAACGNVKHALFASLARRFLAKFPDGDKNVCEQSLPDNGQPRVDLCHRPIEQMHVALGMPGYSFEHKDKYALQVLNIIMGGNMSSRLFDVVREKKGLAYSIGSGTKVLRDTGMFLVRAGVDNQKVVPALELILKELRRFRKSGPTADELTRAKDYLMGQVLLSLEDTMDHMLWLAETVMLRDTVRTLDDIVRRVKKVRAADLQRVARDIFDPQRFRLAVVGPLQAADEAVIRKLICRIG